MFKYAYWMVSLLILVNACNQSDTRSNREDFNQKEPGSTLSKDAYEVIYSLYLPTDIVHLFEETGTSFNPNLLIPLDRVPLYENPGQIALIMGALGVDLSYCKLFERGLESADNFKHIELLAHKLDLPQEIFEKSSDDLEEYMNKPDSLTVLIEKVYGDVDSYFKNNNQESLASLSLFGGWLETMYIGVRIYQDKSILEMGDRILQQKYALNSLSGLLANHQESLIVRRYMHPLNNLKEAYEEVKISYSQDGFEMDQKERTIHASISDIIYEPETLDNICQIITKVRAEILQ